MINEVHATLYADSIIERGTELGKVACVLSSGVGTEYAVKSGSHDNGAKFG